LAFLRISLGVFVAGTAGLAFLAYREYRSLIDYCADSPEVRAGGARFSCLEPPHWAAITVFGSFAVFLEVGLVILVFIAFVRWRSMRPRRRTTVS